ncbi:hypothetical protein BDZ97DRAFT_1920703 [Flammula alnicola]|nr:hypothetical protein BDZ97DRAFT_1920703 [Flammula alnicola]
MPSFHNVAHRAPLIARYPTVAVGSTRPPMVMALKTPLPATFSLIFKSLVNPLLFLLLCSLLFPPLPSLTYLTFWSFRSSQS